MIENTQRDLNIALMNELSAICHLLNIDTMDVVSRGANQMEFPAVHTRPGGWSLYRRRSLLPDTPGGKGRLSS